MFQPGPTNSLIDVTGLLVGHEQDEEALTGITVVLCPTGASAGACIRGGGSGTRETPLLDPLNAVEKIHGIALSGGSAFGLDAAGGVMSFLEEQGIGFDTGVARVPLVPQAILFDLAIGKSDVRPDKSMAYRACQNATSNPPSQGNVGAGSGATIGKFYGMDRAMKSGLGTASVCLTNGLTVSALVVVNAMGDVYENNQLIAGLRTPDSTGLSSTFEAMMNAAGTRPMQDEEEKTLLSFQESFNTTIGVVATNASFNKTEMAKVAAIAHHGLIRAIRPVHTSVDGDTLFALSLGEFKASLDIVGEMASQAVEKAILNGVKKAVAAGGLPAWQDFQPS